MMRDVKVFAQKYPKKGNGLGRKKGFDIRVLNTPLFKPLILFLPPSHLGHKLCGLITIPHRHSPAPRSAYLAMVRFWLFVYCRLIDLVNDSQARGPKKHLKRLNAPKHWMLSKMDGIWVK